MNTNEASFLPVAVSGQHQVYERTVELFWIISEIFEKNKILIVAYAKSKNTI